MRYKEIYKNFSYQLLSLIIILTTLEIFSFFFISYDQGFKKTLKYNPVILMLYKLVNNKTLNSSNMGGFSPLVQDRYRPNTNFGPLKINKCGYISNKSYLEFENDKCIEDLKNKGAFKIFLLGGSSMAGSGSSNNEDTISSHLEKKFEKYFPNKNIKVFNFGAGGSYSYRQTQLMISELTHYKPNIVISFDGFNDAFYWALEPKKDSKKLKDNLPIPNWSDISYVNYLTNSGFQNPSKGSYFFPYLKKSANMISSKIFKNKSPWNFSSEYLLSRRNNINLEASDYFYQNTVSSASSLLLPNNNSCYVQIIQGDLHHKSKKSNEDIINGNKFHLKFEKLYGIDFSIDNYKKNMLPLYADYVNALKEDKSNLKKFFNGRFEWLDYRYLMSEKASYKTTYIDNIHTNKLGNFLIANEIFNDLKNSKCFKVYLEN